VRGWRESGFTLIELSIALVIIGLIVGGVLAGQSLIAAAGVRAQISQIEKFNTAANVFRGKYGYLPGDIRDPDASNFGFQPRGQYAGEGDGNGLIEGNTGDCSGCNYGASVVGETSMFWVDLSAANLIEGGFNLATPTTDTEHASNVSQWLPQAKINTNDYIYIAGFSGINRFYIGTHIYFGGGYAMNGGGQAGPSCVPVGICYALTVQQAYAIDFKIDDGKPGSGNVRAELISPYPQWSGSGVYNAFGDDGSSVFVGYQAIPPTALSCFDNGNTAYATANYTLSQNNGAGVNCDLSFRFQAGD
jgi:prepilin-type N-terminal cleavage/methylation domain-containing protein